MHAERFDPVTDAVAVGACHDIHLAAAKADGQRRPPRSPRGHRLGLLVKLAMLDLLAEREPQVSQILTHNADGNEHMIAINTALGFEVLDRQVTWELGAAAGSVAAAGP